jgi:hypothetical protein
MNFQNIETKQDSAAKLLETQGKPTRHYLFAKEFNETNKRTTQALVDRMAQTVKFRWGKSVVIANNVEEDNLRYFGDPAIDRKYLLGVRIQNDSILNHADAVEIVLERYKPKRASGGWNSNFKSIRSKAKASGWRTPNFSDDRDSPNYSLRKGKLPITEKESWLDFGQEHFFEFGEFMGYPPVDGAAIEDGTLDGNMPKAVLGAKGCGTNRNKRRANHYIRFRFRVVINGVSFLSVPTDTLMMRASLEQEKSGSPFYVITYEYT